MDEQDWTSCSLAEKLVHRSWKARTAAYEEIGKKCFSFAENEFVKHSDHLKGMVADSNQVAQETGLSTLIQFLSHAPAPISVKCTRNTIVPLVVSKTFGSGRAGTKAMALDVLMIYVELDMAEYVINEVIAGLDHKTPKNVLFAVYALKEIVRAFGVPTINLKIILKQLGKIFDHKDASVRNMGTELAIEIYKWIGPAISNFISNLKPIQLKELNQVFENTSYGSQKATRFTRSSRKDASTPTLEKSMTQETLVGGEENAESEAFDPVSLIEPVNVMDKLPKHLYENLADQKWKVRKEALENLYQILSVPKYADGKYGELVSSLGKRMNDSNILVVSLAANCIEKLALGLNSSFAQYKSIIFSSLVDRMKEKKPQVVEAIKSALDAIFKAVSDLSMYMDDFSAGFSHKNPQVRTEILKWLTRCMTVSKKQLNKAELKLLATCLLKGMDDGEASTREASAEAMGTLMKLVSEKSLYPYIEKLDKIKEAKVKDYYQKASSSHNAISAAPKLKKSPKSVPKPELSVTVHEAKVKPLIKAVVKSKEKLESSPSAKIDQVKFAFTNESAMDHVLQSSLAEHVEAVRDSNWKIRLEALNNIFEKIRNGAAQDLKSEVIIRFFGTHPGWKESNFQILNQMMNTIQYLASSTDSFDTGSASLVIPVLAEKLFDIKLNKSATGALDSIVNVTSIQFVISQLHPLINSIKNPKSLCEVYNWIKDSVLEYGLKDINMSSLVDSLKKGFSNSNQAVRGAAISAFSILNSLSKKDLLSLVGDISPQVMQSLNKECEAVKNSTPIKAIRAQKQSNNQDSNTEDVEIQDISGLIVADLVENMNDSNWKIRKAALDDLLNILKGVQGRIKPNLGSDLYSGLKLRLNDSNKNLVIEASEIIGELATVMGSSFEKPMKLLLLPTLSTLTDPKPQVRQTIIETLSKIRSNVGLQMVIPGISSTLMTDHLNLRKDLLKWLTEQSKDEFMASDYQQLVHPIFICLQDRNTEVRKLAQELFMLMGNELGADILKEKASDLFRGASLASLTPFLDSLKPVHAAKAPVVEKTDSVSKSKPKSSKPRGLPADTAKTLPRGASAESLNLNFTNILVTDFKAKEQRAAADKGILKWNFESPRKDLTDHLSEQCSTIFSTEFHALLFSNEHYKERDHMNGLARLCDELHSRHTNEIACGLTSADLKQRYLSCSDMLLKYITIRFFDTNTTILLKVLEFLELLFTSMEEEGYLLSDYEASCFLPFLINKVSYPKFNAIKAGESKETLRSKIREIVRGLSRLYPASKLFLYVIKGLDSKNSRTRTESLDELAYLIQRNGISVCIPPKVFPLITQQVGDRDPGVRNAALGVIIQAYAIIGDAIYKHLGRLNDKDRSLIEEKIKRCAPDLAKVVENSTEMLIKKELKRSVTPTKRTEAIQKTAVDLPLNVKKEFSLDLDFIEGDLKPASSKTRLSSDEPSNNSLLSWVKQIDVKNPNGAILMVKKIEDQLSRDPESLNEISNDVAVALTNHVDKVFSSTELLTSDGARLAKHLLNASILIFSSNSLAKSLDKKVLHRCLDVPLMRLLDPNLTGLEQGVHLSKMMNILMVRALQNIHPNLAFSIMLDILGTSAEKMLDLSDISLINQSKHTELVMKCTWKLIKAIPQMLQEQLLDIPPLLLDIHDFLMRTPPLEWKRRASLSIPQADMPLRTVKTILSMILSNVGNGYEAYITLIPEPASSYAVQYLKQMGDSSKKDKSLSASEIKARLAVIFDKISNKEETKAGIQELYEFQKNHPYAHELIEDRLSQSGAYFQGYIRRGMNHLKESETSVSDLGKPNFSYETIGVSNSSLSFNKPVLSNVIATGKDEVTHASHRKDTNASGDAVLPAMDRSLAVAELKERLAKMKLNMTKNAITEMTILRNSLIKLSKDFESVDLGCIGEGEVSLYLGDNWFVSVQKTDALEIIERRIQFLDSQISTLQFAALKAEMSDFVDIVEQEDESTSYTMPSDNTYCKQTKQVGEFEENLFKLIKDLEKQEISEVDDSIQSDSESQCEQDSVDSIKKHVHFAADTKFDEPFKSTTVHTAVKDLIVEREVESFDDDSDLEDYHIGRQVSREYVALRDRIGISDQELQHKGRGLDTFKPKLSQFKMRSLASKEI